MDPAMIGALSAVLGSLVGGSATIMTAWVTQRTQGRRALVREENLSEMLAVAAQLSKSFWFVRVDLYSNGTHVYVGELTHCADNCDGRFMPPSAERRVSDYLFGNMRSVTN